MVDDDSGESMMIVIYASLCQKKRGLGYEMISTIFNNNDAIQEGCDKL